MQLRSLMPKSMPTSGKSSEPAASAEDRRLPVRLELERTHVSPARKSLLGRKAARHYNRFVVIAARAPLHARANHPVGQIRSIRLDKPLRRLERVRFSGDHNKMCI